MRVRVIDSHTGGEPTRTVISGLEAGELDTWRRGILCEPRGHEVLVGALLAPAADPAHVAAVTFFNNVGLLGMCGHGMIGVVATLRHMGRIQPGLLSFETPVGIVPVTLHEDGRVSVRNVRCWRKAVGIKAGGVTGDVVWGGNWFFLADAGDRPLNLAAVPQLTRDCLEIRAAVHAAGYPEVDHIDLFGPPADPANHSRNFTLCPGGEFDRSPCGTGTSAKLAALAAAGRLQPGQVWRQESVIGSVFEGSFQPAPEGGVLPTITGEAFVTAESELIFDPRDPFRHGL